MKQSKVRKLNKENLQKTFSTLSQDKTPELHKALKEIIYNKKEQ